MHRNAMFFQTKCISRVRFSNLRERASWSDHGRIVFLAEASDGFLDQILDLHFLSLAEFVHFQILAFCCCYLFRAAHSFWWTFLRLIYILAQECLALHGYETVAGAVFL